MSNVSRRGFLAVALAAPALLANTNEAFAAKKKKKAKKKTKTAELGQEVMVSRKGKLGITVVGCETSESLTAEYMDCGITIADENCVIALMLVVNNKSVKTPDDMGFEYRVHGVRFVDTDGVSLSPFNTGSDYKGYACALNGYLNALRGQSDREVLYFQVPRGTSEIAAILGDTKVTIPVQQV